MRIPWKKRVAVEDEWIDEVGREVARAAALADAEADAAVASPFAYARLRARIDAENRRRSRPADWAVQLRVVRMAVPAMALITIIAAGSFWFAAGGGTEAMPTRAVSVSACAITTDEELAVDACSISSDEVLAVIVNRARQEGQR
jgi:hypothetical protein